MESNLKRDGAAIPLEVIEIILSNLGVSDLLNFRLVDLDWNQECLKQLRKSKGRKRVDRKNIDSVLEFLKKSSASPFAESWVLPFKFYLYLDWDTIEGPSSALLDKLNQVCSLTQLAPRSISGLDICGIVPSTEDKFRSFVQILSKCSSHLRNLEIWFWKSSTTSISKSLAANILEEEILMFPNLKRMSVAGHSISCPATAEEGLLQVLMRQSPSLGQLEFSDFTYFDQKTIWPLSPLPKLKKLKVVKWDGRLDLMNLMPAPHIIPNLESLYIRPYTSQFENERQTQSLQTILSTFSATLKSFAVDNFASRRSLGGYTVVSPLKFPVMSSLEHLRVELEHNYECMPVYANLEEFNFCQANFPALKSVDIQLGFYLGLPAAAAEPPNSPVQKTFSSVQRLRLRIHRHSIGLASLNFYPQNFLQEYMTHIQAVFSNLNHFSVIAGNADNRHLRPVLAAVGSSSLLASRIRTFEVMYPYELCSQVDTVPLSAGEQSALLVLPVNNMQNVTKFRMLSESCQIQNIVLKLRWFTEQFPSLTRIEILTKRTCGCNEKPGDFSQISNMFPNIEIEIDHYDYWIDF